MFNWKLVLIPAFFILFLFSLTECEFQPDDVPLTEVNPPEEPGPPIIMTLNNLIDTIKIGWKTDFSYAIAGTPNKIYSVIITFEGKLLHNYIGEYGQTTVFHFNPSDYHNGKYHLNIKIITSSGSGSIADKIGAEGFMYEDNWPVIIDKTLPEGSALEINAIKTTKGISLSWNSFNHPNFNSYRVYRHYSVFQPAPVRIAEITDPLITSFTDSTYWEGQNSHYYLEIMTPAGSSLGGYIWFFDHLTGLKATWHNDGTTFVTWNKAKNIESFGKYYICTKWTFSTVFKEYFISGSENNSITLENTGFGSGLYIFLKFIPREVTENLYGWLESVKIELLPPPEMTLFSRPVNVNNHNFLLLADWKKVYRYLPYDSRTEDSISVNLETYWLITVSHDGNKFAYYQDDNFFIRRTADFHLENEFPGPPLRSLYSTIEGCSLSDDGKLLAVDNAGNVYLYNSSTGSLMRKDSLDVRGYPVKLAFISPDGAGMVAQTNASSVCLYTLKQEGWAETARTVADPFTIFYSKDGSSVYIASISEMQKRSAENLSLMSHYSIPDGYVRSVDPDHGTFFLSFMTAPENVLVELNTGRILVVIPGYISNCTPFDNYLITSGRQLILPEF